MHLDVDSPGHQFLLQHLSQSLRVAVHSAIDYRHVFLELRAAPFVVLLDDPHGVFPVDRSVAWSDDFDTDTKLFHLLDGASNEHQVGSDYRREIPSRLFLNHAHINLIVEDITVEDPIRTERVAGEKDLILNDVGHHGLRPV